jgi:hypothetical protein
MASSEFSQDADDDTSDWTWHVEGVDPKAREVARSAARRGGLSVGQWLNSLIIESASIEQETSTEVQRQEIGQWLDSMIENPWRRRSGQSVGEWLNWLIIETTSIEQRTSTEVQRDQAAAADGTRSGRKGQNAESAVFEWALANIGPIADEVDRLVQKTGAMLAAMSARGDRIDRVQAGNRAALDALLGTAGR